MRKHNAAILYSPSDLNGFLGCPHSTFLDLKDLDTPLARAQDDDHLQLIQEKGLEHEQSYLAELVKTVRRHTNQANLSHRR